MNKEIEKLIEKAKTTKPEVIDELKEIADMTEIPEDELLDEWYSVYNDDILSKHPDEKKMVLATRRIRAKYAGILMSQGKEYIVQVLDKLSIRSGKNKKTDQPYTYGELYGIAKQTDEDVVAFCRVSVNGKMLDKYDEIQIGSTYKVKLGGSFKDEMFNLRTDDASRFEETDPLIEQSIEEFFIEKYGLIEVADALNENPTAFSSSRYDLRVVYGDVANSFSATGSSGRDYGKYVLVDDSVDFATIRELGGLNIFVDPEQVRYATGSSIYAIGRISKGQNGVVMNAYIILPDIVIDRYQINDEPEEQRINKKLAGL